MDIAKDELLNWLYANDRGKAWEAIALLGKYGWLYDGSLDGINLSGLEFAMVSFYGAILKNADFSHSILLEVDFEDAVLIGTTFKKALLAGAVMLGTNMEQVCFDEADATGSTITGNLVKSSFNSTNLDNSIIGGDIRLASFISTQIRNAKIINADLRGATLKNAILTDTIAQNITMDETTILPDGTYWVNEASFDKFL